MTVLMIVVVLTLLISATCSFWEATLYSSRVGALEAASVKGKNKELAGRFLHMKDDISAPIATILLVNTVANTAGATLSGMYAAQILGAASVPVFSLGLTLAILFLAEILPKTLGAMYWRQLWPFVVRPLATLQYLLSPAVWVTEKFAGFFMRGAQVPSVTEDEILAMARLGADVGEISHEESKMVHSILELEEKQVRDILTPWPVLFMLDASSTVAEALQAVREQRFSRIPIYEHDRDNIVGYVTVHDLAGTENAGKRQNQLKTLAKPIMFIPDTANCLSVLTTALKQRRQIAMVVNEHGNLVGLVTLEDLIETALGAEIVDETDQVVDLREKARFQNSSRRIW